jgi:hypothetical protein
MGKTMLRKIVSIVYLLTGLSIAFGAFGHDSNARNLAAEFAKFPAFDAQALRVIYAVWHFVSGCMIVFGLTVVWTWLRARKGDPGVFLPSDAIGVFYVLVGVASVLYTGMPFFAVFCVLGGLLLVCAQVLRRTS